MQPEGSTNNLLQAVSSSSKLETVSSSTLDIPLSLCIITQFFPPDYAPTGQLIDELAQFLNQQKINVEVFSGQPGYAFRFHSAPSLECRNRVRIRRSRISQIWPQRIRGKAISGLLFFIRAAIHVLKAHRFHNVFLLTTAPAFLPVLGYLAHRIFNVSYVCLVYDLYPDIAIELGVISQQHLLAKFWRWMNRLVWRNAEGVIVLSSAMKQKIVEYCPEVENKVSIIHSWADSRTIVPIHKQRNWFAWKYHLVEHFTVLYSGNMGRCHDMTTILEAIKQLRNEAIRFVFIGGGAQRATFIEQVQALGLTNCLFLPYQEKEVLPYSLTACNLSLVSVNAGMENLVAPSKLYSALSAGRPIAAICPKNSYINHLISEANCGATFDNGDSQGLVEFIRFLSRDAAATERLGQNGRQHLERNFSPEIVTEEYIKVFQKALLAKQANTYSFTQQYQYPSTSPRHNR
jgi:glycosyltransferase involved in cell wall biosynthesis